MFSLYIVSCARLSHVIKILLLLRMSRVDYASDSATNHRHERNCDVMNNTVVTATV